jgi:AraC-like DNA-binding protein
VIGAVVVAAEVNMNAIPLLRICGFSPIVDFLDQMGTPTNRLLAQAKLPFSIREEPESLIPLYQSSDFLETVAHLEAVPALGILVGQSTSICRLGTFGKLVCNAVTLLDLLTTLEEMVQFINAGEQCSLRWEKDWVWLQHHCLSPTNAPNLQTQYYDLMLYISAVRMALGPTWHSPELYLEGPPCRELIAMDEFARTYIHFMHPYNAIKIPRSALSAPINVGTEQLDTVLQPEYETFQQSAPATEFLPSLRQLVRSLLPTGETDIQIIARAADTSVRTLQRNLTEAGITYSQVITQVRYERAQYLLQQTDRQLLDIALELGYTDQANFTRAFKRWTGRSPQAFRENHSDEQMTSG